MKGLLMDGWVDAALVLAQRHGREPEPTCQRATRHTFCVVNPLLVPMLRESQVCFHEDLATHAVLVTEFDLPQNNFRVHKWIMPKALDGVAFDSDKMQVLAEQVGSERWRAAVDEPLNIGKVDEAFANWSEIAEAVLLSSVKEGEVDVSKPAWSGRGQLVEPVLRTWAPPRFHAGRPGDFRLEMPSVALQARRWQKLVRQIEALLRKLRAGVRDGDPRRFDEETQCIWLAIVGSPIRPRFTRWAFDLLGFALHRMPSPEILDVLYTAAAGHAHEVSKQCWKAKREIFVGQVQAAWDTRGGSFAFRLLREQAHPPVMEMRVRTPVRLAPQRWLPDGKQWIQVQDVTGFQTGDCLEGTSECRILEVQGNSLRLDVRLSRKEAAGLEKVEVSLDPEVWSRSFFQGWSAYWQRESEEAADAPWRQLLYTLPSVEASPLDPVGFSDWKYALGRAKASSMRGTCGWSVGELKKLPESVVLPLLRLFTRVEQGATWPKQLQQWLVVLLRKEEGIPEWSSVRPISVASVVYRIWSRIRTRQLLAWCQQFSLPTVGPRLPTRSLWGYVADFVAEEMHAGKAPSGLVLDIVKAFNVLCRPMVGDVMKHCGIDVALVDAWLRALDGMERYVLVAGNVYRADPSHRASVTGVPEGDPLSVVAMYCMCRFFALWIQSKAAVMPLTYADNWQVLASQTGPVLEALPHVAHFLTCCALPISPHKCWLWSASGEGCKRLKAAALGQDRVPVKLQSVDLGADLPYCRRRAAAKRNQRVSLGHKRLLRAKGVPCSRWRKTRLVLSGIWPQCLHGAETCQVPLTVLRTQAGRVVSMAKPGVSPWIAVRCGTGGVSYLLAKQLRGLGWLPVGLEARDDYGRVLHLVETPLKTVRRVLESSWLDQVAANLRHRKACEDVQHIDSELSRAWIKFPLAEQSLLLTQLTGVTYTRDCLSHAVGLEVSRACPLCGMDDSRLHRVKFCEAVQSLRRPFMDFLDQRALPDHTWAFGLWDEPSEVRDWQASMCEIDWPFDLVSTTTARQFVFSDGSCLSPRNPRLSVAGGAVILAHSNGNYEVVWSGLVPGLEQSSYRGELLAITVALASFSCVTVFCDNQEVVKVAARLLKLPFGQRESCLPSEHRDLWSFFCVRTAARLWGPSVVRWVKAHQNPALLQGEARILATFNGYADAEAKKVVIARARHETYRGLFTALHQGKVLAAKLADLHVAIAQAFVEVDQVPGIPLDPAGFGYGALAAGSQVHTGFGDTLVSWLGSLRWYHTCAAGWTHTSAVELLWQFIYDTGWLPPFWYGGQWHVLEESVLNSFVLPKMSGLFRAWVRALRGVDGLDLVSGANAVPFAGTGLAGWSIEGKLLQNLLDGRLPDNWDRFFESFPADPKGLATRQSSSACLNYVSKGMPWLLGGSADLANSCLTTLKDAEDGADFLPPASRWGHYRGRNLHFGIREHAMGSVMNGLALCKLRPFGSTFLVFSDYMTRCIQLCVGMVIGIHWCRRPPIRMAAIMEVPSIFIFTHDSIGVGEDGPTHQPVEQLGSLRCIPGLSVFRPADANECVPLHEPVAVVLSRQALPTLDRQKFSSASGLHRGGYILHDSGSCPDLILMASGSEVHLMLEAHEVLSQQGVNVRSVSVPCMELFKMQPQERTTSTKSFLGSAAPASPLKLDGEHVGMISFGASGPSKRVQEDWPESGSRSCYHSDVTVFGTRQVKMIGRMREGMSNLRKKDTPLEAQLKEATSRENWGVPNTTLQAIAHATQNMEDNDVIMAFLWKVLQEIGRWLRVTGQWKEFRYMEEGKDSEPRRWEDVGSGIRSKASSILEMLSDEELLNEEKEKAENLKKKMSVAGVGGSAGNVALESGGSGSAFKSPFDRDAVLGPSVLEKKEAAGGKSTVKPRFAGFPWCRSWYAFRARDRSNGRETMEHCTGHWTNGMKLRNEEQVSPLPLPLAPAPAPPPS
eukprot:s1164_g2.t1